MSEPPKIYRKEYRIEDSEIPNLYSFEKDDLDMNRAKDLMREFGEELGIEGKYKLALELSLPDLTESSKFMQIWFHYRVRNSDRGIIPNLPPLEIKKSEEEENEEDLELIETLDPLLDKFVEKEGSNPRYLFFITQVTLSGKLEDLPIFVLKYENNKITGYMFHRIKSRKIWIWAENLSSYFPFVED